MRGTPIPAFDVRAGRELNVQLDIDTAITDNLFFSFYWDPDTANAIRPSGALSSLYYDDEDTAKEGRTSKLLIVDILRPSSGIRKCSHKPRFRGSCSRYIAPGKEHLLMGCSAACHLQASAPHTRPSPTLPTRR